MRQLTKDARFVIAIAKGDFDRDSYKLAERYIAEHVYGIEKMNRHVLARYLREVIGEARVWTTERLERFHAQAVEEAFKWTKEFSWDGYLRWHFAEISGLRVRDGNGTTFFDMSLSPDEQRAVAQLAEKQAQAVSESK